jgi:hypothetical protein
LNEKEKSKNTPPSVTLADDMPDDDDKPTPIPFTGDVTVDRTRVQVTLLLRPGLASVANTERRRNLIIALNGYAIERGRWSLLYLLPYQSYDTHLSDT